MADAASISSTALAVQIENHPAARPVRNLGLADMVVEVTVEGDVTRFTAIFQCQPTLGLTGPVRSARYYTIDVWQDLHVLPFFFGAGTEELRRYAAPACPTSTGSTEPGLAVGSPATDRSRRPTTCMPTSRRSSRLGSYTALDNLRRKPGPHAAVQLRRRGVAARQREAGRQRGAADELVLAHRLDLGPRFRDVGAQRRRGPDVDEATGKRIAAGT